MSTGSSLRKLRQDLGVLRSQVAATAGTTQQIVFLVEQDRYPADEDFFADLTAAVVQAALEDRPRPAA